MDVQTAPSPEDILIARQDSAEIDRALDRFLSPRVSLAVRLHYGLRCEPRYFKDIAPLYGVQPARVQQLVKKAERRLARPLSQTFPERYAVMEKRRKEVFGDRPWPINWQDKVRDHEWRQQQQADIQRRDEERGRWLDEQAAQHHAHLGAWAIARRERYLTKLQQRAEAFYQTEQMRRVYGIPLWPKAEVRDG